MYHEDKQIQILTGYPSKTFWFESCEEQWTGDSWEYIGPGDIDRIYVEWANPMVNQVNIWIRGNGHVWGARDVRFIDLDYCNLSDLKILTILGNLGYTALWGLDRVGGGGRGVRLRPGSRRLLAGGLRSPDLVRASCSAEPRP